MTMRWAVRGGVGPGLLDLGERRGPRVDHEASRGDLLGEGGQFGEDLPGADGALPAAHDLEAGGAERGGGDRCAGAGHRPDFDPGQGLTAVGAPGDDGGHRGGGGFAPEVVDHDVGVGGGLAEPLGDAGGVPVERPGGERPGGERPGVEQHGAGGAEGGQASQPAGVAPGRDDLVRAETPGDLDGHLAGVPGGPEDENVLPGLERHPLAQRDPGGHGRVHGRGDRDGVGVLGQDDAAAGVDDGLLGHRAQPRVREDEVAQQPVRAAPDTVDARHQRQFAGAGVVRPVGLRPDARVQPGRDHVDDHLVVPRRGGGGELLVAGGGVERGNDRSLHDDLRNVVGNTN